MNDKWTKVVNGLSLLVDEAQANWIVEVERLETAKARVELYDQEQRHLCITPGCRNPVVGRLIFAHCEKHLKPYERRWLEEGIESVPGAFRAHVDPANSFMASIDNIVAKKDEDLAEQNVSKKMLALAAARDLVDKTESWEAERRAYLPEWLREKTGTARMMAKFRLW